MDPRYRQLKDMSDMGMMRDIINISRLIKIPQKTVYLTLDIYYRSVAETMQHENLVSTCSAYIMLSGKICGPFKSLEHILDTSHKYYGIKQNDILFEEDYDAAIEMELLICITIDFDFEVKDPYEYLEKMCVEHGIEERIAKITWTMLNDSAYLPLAAFFCIEDIVVSCIYISKIREDEDYDISKLMHYLKGTEFDSESISLISDEITSLYESVCI